MHRHIFECMTRIFPKVVNNYSEVSQYLKDLWFNEFKVIVDKWIQKTYMQVILVNDFKVLLTFIY